MSNYWYCTVKLHNRTGTALILTNQYLWPDSERNTHPDTSWSDDPEPRIKPGQVAEFGQQYGELSVGTAGTKENWFGGGVQYAMDLEEDWQVGISWEWPTKRNGESPVYLSCPPGYFIRAANISGDKHHVTTELDLEEMITGIDHC